MEHVNARALNRAMFPEPPTLAVMDVSFISIRLILPALFDVLGQDGRVISLIKPQFEAGRSEVGKHGVVRDRKVHEEVIGRIMTVAAENGFTARGLTYSPIRGPEGNIEYLLWLEKGTGPGPETGGYTDEIKITVDTAFERL